MGRPKGVKNGCGRSLGLLGKELRARWKAKGICNRCGRHPARQGRSTCSECANLGRERLRDRRKSKICFSCGSITLNSSKFCDQCRAKYGKSAKAKREKLKEDGICINCCIEPAISGQTLCSKCAAQNRDHHRSIKKKCFDQ